MVYGLIVLR